MVSRVRSASAFALVMIWGTGCFFSEVDLEGKRCPCVSGWECDPFTKVCVPEGSVTVRDAGSRDTTTYPDARADTGVRDADPQDASTNDAIVTDVGVDSGLHPDAAEDSGIIPDIGPNEDATVPDSGSTTPCIRDIECNPPASICISGACSAGCNHGLNCTPSVSCDPSGHCVELGGQCNSSSDCNPGPPEVVCVDSSCQLGCIVASNGCTGNRRCNTNTGYCGPPPTCQTTSECNDPELVCSGSSCVRRCDLPGANPCFGSSTCNTTTGQCDNGLPLGDNCTVDSACASGVCLQMQNPSVQFCSLPCAATSDCPIEFSCIPEQGATYCIRQSVFSSSAMTTLSGASCTNPSNACQSLICDGTSLTCIERCSRHSDCAGYGDFCADYTTGSGTPLHFFECYTPVGGLDSGEICSGGNSDCKTRLCNRYRGFCVDPCCTDFDCPTNHVCSLYDLESNREAKLCQRSSGSAGTLQYGDNCSQPLDCASENCVPSDPSNLGSQRICTTYCCTNQDCEGVFPANLYPLGGYCAQYPSPLGGLATICAPF